VSVVGAGAATVTVTPAAVGGVDEFDAPHHSRAERFSAANRRCQNNESREIGSISIRSSASSREATVACGGATPPPADVAGRDR
jgi:hypothetical protein